MASQLLAQGLVPGLTTAGLQTLNGVTVNSWILSEIGEICMINGKEYVLCQFQSAVPAGGGLGVSYGIKNGAPDYTNCILSTTSDDYKVCGVLPLGQVAIAAAGLAWVQISGPAQYYADSAVVAGQLLNVGGTTAGRLSNVSDTEAGVIGISLTNPQSADALGWMMIRRIV